MNGESDPNEKLLAPDHFCIPSGIMESPLRMFGSPLSNLEINCTPLCKEISSTVSCELDDSLRLNLFKGTHDCTESMFNLKLPEVKVNEKDIFSPHHLNGGPSPKDLTFYHCFNFNNSSYLIEGKHIASISDIRHKDSYSTSNLRKCDISSAKCASCPPFPNVQKGAYSNDNIFNSCDDLLTPDSFVLSQDKEKTFVPNVPEFHNQASQIPEFSSNTKRCTNLDVQKVFNLINFKEPPDLNNSNDILPKDYNVLKEPPNVILPMDHNIITEPMNVILSKDHNKITEPMNTGRCHSDDEKQLQKSVLTPESFLNSSSARRKLTFEMPEIEAKLEANDFPEFKCALDIPESIYEDFNYKPKDCKVFLGLADQRISIPPIGVFWDIENCGVPKGMSAIHVVQAIRNRFFEGYREAEFVCVCDTLKENPKVLEELNDAQVNIMHVGSFVKNAADDKLLQSMRRFADLHGAGSGASIILISGDSDFATELYDLRYRKGLHIILVHNAHAQDSLKLSAHETVLFSEVTQQLPHRRAKSKTGALSRHVVVWNIPSLVESGAIRRKLHILSSNCGGKSINIQDNYAKITFPTHDHATRAKKRIEGENVYGSRVYCTFGKSDKDNLKHKQTETKSATSTKNFEETGAIGQYKMEIGVWNKSTGSSKNNSCCNNWRLSSPSQITNGNSFNSSSILNSSSQGSSSKGNSPHSLYFQKTPETHRTLYRGNSPVLPTKNDFRSLDSMSYDKTTQLWPGSSCKGNWGTTTVQYQPEFHNSSYGLGNLSLADTSQLEESSEELKVTLVDRSYINDLWIKSRRILWDEAKCSLAIKEFTKRFSSRYNEVPKADVLKKDLVEYIQMDEDEESGEINLVPVQVFARDLLILMNEAGGRMLLINFESAYLNRFGVACRPATLGFPNLVALVQCLGEFASVKGRGSKRILVLNRDLVNELPNYCPPATRVIPNNSEVEERWTTYIPCNPVPPPQFSQPGNSSSPQTYFHTNGLPPTPFSKANGIPPSPSLTPACDHNLYHKDMSDSHMLLGLTPSPPQPTYQPPSTLMYPGSPAAANGSVMWGQMWSPQYTVMPPLSPAQYMMPTIPINWGSVSSPTLASHSKYSPDENQNYRGIPPVSIKTLDQLGKVSPPNPSELPPPELLTHNPETNLSTPDLGETELVDAVHSPTKGCSGQINKTLAKKRLAAQFGVDGKE